MQVFNDPTANLELEKFGIAIPLTDRRAQRVCDFLQASRSGIVDTNDLRNPIILTPDLVKLAHTDQYCQQIYGTTTEQEQALINTFELYDAEGNPNRYSPVDAKFPLSQLSTRALRQAQGTLNAAVAALELEATFFLGGGFHHAMTFGGRGFCFVNDIVIAARYLQKNHDIGKVWVIDIDVHKGDGTAEITCNDNSIATLSIHMAEGWPLDNPQEQDQPWYIPSTVEIPIRQGEEGKYLAALQQGLEQLEQEGRPDFVFVIQGSDPYEKDQLPSSSLIKLSLDEMRQRDALVFDFIRRLQVPQCHLMAGGYGEHSHEPFLDFFKQLMGRGLLK